MAYPKKSASSFELKLSGASIDSGSLKGDKGIPSGIGGSGGKGGSGVQKQNAMGDKGIPPMNVNPTAKPPLPLD